ncbi:MAG: 4Fe-4S binding protein, partial [Chloroflexia bacterium]|nr:4Fe-4S binding protein [Chloroflexia bacterium]
MILEGVKKYKLSITCFVVVAVLLTIVHLKTSNQIIIIERFIDGFAYLEICGVAFYAAFLIHKMKDPKKVPLWRHRSWFLFSMVFFGQLLLGLIGFEKFLMTGKLHLPIPAMILSGPMFRGEASFMTILFFSTVILSGPTWCSHLCYFGAIDGLAAKGKTNKKPVKNKFRYKHSILLLVVASTTLLRLFNVEILYAVILGAGFGILGLLIIVFGSKRKHKMIHCIVYCPIGTIIRYLKYINPFRISIQDNCSMCAHCIPSCKYDALNISDLKKQKTWQHVYSLWR